MWSARIGYVINQQYNEARKCYPDLDVTNMLIREEAEAMFTPSEGSNCIGILHQLLQSGGDKRTMYKRFSEEAGIKF